MRDLRDPQALGEAILLRRRNADHYVETDGHPHSPAHVLATLADKHDDVPDYDCGDGPLERYGDPREHHRQRVAEGREAQP